MSKLRIDCFLRKLLPPLTGGRVVSKVFWRKRIIVIGLSWPSKLSTASSKIMLRCRFVRSGPRVPRSQFLVRDLLLECVHSVALGMWPVQLRRTGWEVRTTSAALTVLHRCVREGNYTGWKNGRVALLSKGFYVCSGLLFLHLNYCMRNYGFTYFVWNRGLWSPGNWI